PRVGRSRSPTRRLRERAVDGGEVDDRADLLAPALADVELADAGDEAQMVVGAAAPVAVEPVCAHVTVRDGLGVGRGRRVCREVFLEPSTDESEVGVEMRRAIWLAFERRHDVDVLRE